MKYLLISGIVLFSAYGYAQTKVSQEVSKVSDVDSFYYYYNILDSISKKNAGYDKSIVCGTAITYMERTTSIKAHPDGSYIGWRRFSSSDLVKWEMWFKRKYPSLKFESKVKSN